MERSVRLKRPERRQVEWRPSSLDQLIPQDHRVRVIWSYVEGLDFSSLYERVAAVEGGPGRDAVDPKILLALWIFATTESISSARQIARLCERDVAYMWICGGVGVNYHLLSDFRSTNPEFFDELLTQMIATMMQQGLVTLEEVSQDGMRVRANAGSGSFRREGKLKEHLKTAQAHVRKMREETNDSPTGQKQQAQRDAAKRRAAEDRQRRVEQALEELKELQEQKEKRKKGSGSDARCSTTDPQARKMKMASGGYRPAYNVQFVSDNGARVIVDVNVTNNGSDGGQMKEHHQRVRQRYGVTPQKYLVDGGFTTHGDIKKLEQAGTEVYGPIPKAAKLLANGNDPHARQPRDSDEMFKFRQRMATAEAKETYRKRSSVAEFPNAECRNRGLHQFPVRGLTRVLASALLHAVTFNFMRWQSLQPSG